MKWSECHYDEYGKKKHLFHGNWFGNERTGRVPWGGIELKKEKWQIEVGATCTYSIKASLINLINCHAGTNYYTIEFSGLAQLPASKTSVFERSVCLEVYFMLCITSVIEKNKIL